MRIDRTLWLTALGAVGAALVTFPFLPGSWPCPLPEGERLGQDGLLRLRRAAARVDLACDRGDLGAFAAAVTAAHRARLERQLETVRQPLDAAALRRLAAVPGRSLVELLRQPVLASEVRGRRAAVAVDRPDCDGAQILEFVWDGRRLLLDGSRHAVAAVTGARVRAAVAEAVATKQ